MIYSHSVKRLILFQENFRRAKFENELFFNINVVGQFDHSDTELRGVIYSCLSRTMMYNRSRPNLGLVKLSQSNLTHLRHRHTYRFSG